MFEILVQQTNDRNGSDAKMKVIYEIKEFWSTKHRSGCMYLDVSPPKKTIWFPKAVVSIMHFGLEST